MFDKANEPAAGSGGILKVAQMVDHLLIVRILKYVPATESDRTRKKTVDGVEIEEKIDYILADVVDLDSGTKENPNPEPMYDYMFFQGKLIAHFKNNVGKLLIGTLGQHPATNIQGAYYFTDQSHIMRQAAVGEAWANNNRDFFTTQAPGQQTRKVTQRDAFQTQHETTSSGQSTLELMRNSGNGTQEAPF